MTLHEPFKHPKDKLWSKEGPRVKHAVWLRPLKVGNRSDPGVCRWSATHCWKALKESYKFAWNLIPFRGLNRELWAPKVLGVQFETVLGFLLGSPRTKSHSDAGVAEQRREYYMGEGGAFPRVRAVVSQMSPFGRGLSQHQELFPKVN
jgi:hypothetical protein